MKKSLIAIAATLAVSGAYADSVSVYGLVDYGYLNQTETSGGVETKHHNGIAPNTAAQTRVGFKGHEDLGGGSSAHFVLEFGLDPSATNTSTSVSHGASHNGEELKGTAATTPISIRQGYVSIGNDNFGKLAIGRQQTFTYNALAHTSASNIANLPGSIFYNRPTDFDRANSVSYSVGNDMILVSANYLAENHSGKKKDGSIHSYGAHAFELGTKLTLGQLTANAAYTDAHLGFGTTLPGYGLKALSGSTNAKTVLGNVGYDFGLIKLGYTYYLFDAQAQSTTGTTNVKAQLQEVGAIIPVTPAAELFGSYGLAKIDRGISTDNGYGYQAGGRYNLSKRTSVYAAYGEQQLKAPANYKDSAYTVGLKHTF